MSAIARATLSADGQRLTLEKGLWSESFPVTKLAEKITFYRSLCETPAEKGQPVKPKPSARHYAATLAALVAVERQIKAGAA